jgi:hypothetical protein
LLLIIFINKMPTDMENQPSEAETQNVSMNVSDVNSSPEVKNVNVNVNLLNNIKSILEISTARGTYKATELTAVGKVYDELVVLLQ